MIDINVIQIKLNEWINSVTGIVNMWAEDNGPKPDLPYTVLRINSLIPLGHGNRSENKDMGTFLEINISSSNELVVNAQCYGSNAFGRLEDLKHYKMVESSQVLLQDEGLSFVNERNLQNLTGLNDTLFEERATIDLVFRFASQLEAVNVGLIEHIEVEGTIKTPADKVNNFEIDLT